MIGDTISAQTSAMAPSLDMSPSSTASQEIIDQLRTDIIRHFEVLKLPALNGSISTGIMTKDAIRASHAHQRNEIFQREQIALKPYIKRLYHILPTVRM